MLNNKKVRKKRTILTDKQKYEIANDVFKNLQKQTMVAAKYNITQAAVSKICKDYLMYGDRSLKRNLKRNRIIALEKEVIDLRKRNRDLEMEVEIIKKLKPFLANEKK
ncbi:MAG: hypothetical protein E7Y34_01665 [Mycoplasma sp.]|nr:hypothetical protein [Mycoplasma sp.]